MKRAIIGWSMTLWLISGCDSVSVPEPIGSPVPAAELKSLAGNWVNEDGETGELRLTKAGTLRFGGLEWDEQREEFQSQSIDLVATKCRKLRLLSLKSDDEPQEDGYGFVLYTIKDEKTLQCYVPDVSVFKKAVESGELSGTIDRDWLQKVQVRISASPDELDAFLKKSGDAACFEKKPFGTFRRLKQFE
jgi:hypothetical protein